MSKNIKKNGLFQGYEPNRISFYIILLDRLKSFKY